jgi:hypothetical protein
MILDMLYGTAPNRISIFIRAFLNILIDSLLGIAQLLTDLTEVWKVK